MGGFMHTYCDVTATKDEFYEMFDHTLWTKMRKEYGAESAFPTIYEKVLPEVDILAYAREEQDWGT